MVELGVDGERVVGIGIGPMSFNRERLHMLMLGPWRCLSFEKDYTCSDHGDAFQPRKITHARAMACASWVEE